MIPGSKRTIPAFTDGDFKTSSLTGDVGCYCVEVAQKDGIVAVRDSANRQRGTLYFEPEEWAAFVGGVRLGEFDPK